MEKKYLHRWLFPKILEATQYHQVVAVTGPRQVGKSTLLRAEFSQWRFINLDDTKVLTQAKKDPSFLLEAKQPTFIDEAQRAPELFLEIKRIVDEDASRQFILSGSANFLLMKNIADSLAGRAVYFHLGPMTQGELGGVDYEGRLDLLFQGKVERLDEAFASQDLAALVWKGSMPVLIKNQSPNFLISWREAYISTYLEKDLRDVSEIAYLADFQRLMQVLSLRNGMIANSSEIARDVGISQPTAHRYINILQTHGIIEKIDPYFTNKTKRVVKSPKIMWMDSGIACQLADIYSAEELISAREFGGMLESFFYTQIRQMAELYNPTLSLYFWRTQAGQEVDFILKKGKQLLAIELKASKGVCYQDTQSLQAFMKLHPECSFGIIAYNGEKIIPFSEKIFALPLSFFLS